MAPKVVVVTGASRGVGAETAVALGGRGHHVVVNYREKARRADRVCERVREAGGSALAVQADITTESGRSALIDAAIAEYGRLDVLILNASGGLELDADADYAMRLNRDAQVALTRAAAARIPQGRIVFVTSHQAHFSRTRPVPSGYEPIAASKLAGETALRELIPETGLELRVVSGDMIEGTIVVRLLERRDPGAVRARKEHGPLPTVSEFAAAVAEAADGDAAEAADSDAAVTTYVGGADFVVDTRTDD